MMLMAPVAFAAHQPEWLTIPSGSTVQVVMKKGRTFDAIWFGGEPASRWQDRRRSRLLGRGVPASPDPERNLVPPRHATRRLPDAEPYRPVISQSRVEDFMRVRHSIAAGLAGLLLIQSVARAQAPNEAAARPVPREHAINVLLSNLELGTEIRVQVAGHRQVVGRLVEKSDEELVVVASGLREVIPLVDVDSIGRPLPRTGIGDGKAFGIGAAVGAGILMAVLFLGYFAH
jgi:hypothetical protein